MSPIPRSTPLVTGYRGRCHTGPRRTHSERPGRIRRPPVPDRRVRCRRDGRLRDRLQMDAIAGRCWRRDQSPNSLGGIAVAARDTQLLVGRSVRWLHRARSAGLASRSPFAPGASPGRRLAARRGPAQGLPSGATRSRARRVSVGYRAPDADTSPSRPTDTPRKPPRVARADRPERSAGAGPGPIEFSENKSTARF